MRVAIDLGSANTSIYIANHGIVSVDPTYIANDSKKEAVVAVGETARQMVGRTPEYIQISRPITAGVVSDPVLFEIYVKYLLNEAIQKIGLFNFRNFQTVVSIASNSTQVDSRSLRELFLKIGAGKVSMINQLYAGAVGSKIPFRDIKGQMLIILGDSGTEIGVFSLGKLVFTEVLSISGSKFTQNVVKILRDEFNLLVGQNTAEECKIRSLSNLTSNTREKQKIAVRGRDLSTGLPKTINIDQSLIHESIAKDLIEIANTIKKCIESLPPEIAVDIHDNGINLCGGGAMIAGMDEVISKLVNINTIVVSDPTTAVIRGCGAILENLNDYQDILYDFSV
ncbi:MAG: rod shape-determining protein [Patescibacteria group bacterium]